MPSRESLARGADGGDAADPRGPWTRLARSPWRAVLAAGAGAAIAGAYAYFVGCRTGTCLITSNVWTASLYGAGVGAAVGWPNRAPRAAEERAADRG